MSKIAILNLVLAVGMALQMSSMVQESIGGKGDSPVLSLRQEGPSRPEDEASCRPRRPRRVEFNFIDG